MLQMCTKLYVYVFIMLNKDIEKKYFIIGKTIWIERVYGYFESYQFRQHFSNFSNTHDIIMAINRHETYEVISFPFSFVST
jgi:hypothetical protein